MRDPLAILFRLRAREVDAARRVVLVVDEALADARERAARAAEALLRERENALPADYAAWLTRGRAARDAALRDVRHAEQRAEAARVALAEARAAGRAVERLMEQRAEAVEQRANRQERAALDAAGLRRAAMARGDDLG